MNDTIKTNLATILRTVKSELEPYKAKDIQETIKMLDKIYDQIYPEYIVLDEALLIEDLVMIKDKILGDSICLGYKSLFSSVAKMEMAHNLVIGACNE